MIEVLKDGKFVFEYHVFDHIFDYILILFWATTILIVSSQFLRHWKYLSFSASLLSEFGFSYNFKTSFYEKVFLIIIHMKFNSLSKGFAHIVGKGWIDIHTEPRKLEPYPSLVVV